MIIDRRTVLAGALASGAAKAAHRPGGKGKRSRVPVIDVHTHMYSHGWADVVKAANDPNIRLTPGPSGDSMFYMWSGVGTLGREMFDWDMRIREMDAAGVDLALISLSAPNVFLAERRASAAAARAVNDDFASAQKRYPTRIRWMASLPWDFPEEAAAELKRAAALGAIGVCMITNISGRALTEPRYRSVWRQVEASGLPVFIHPTLPKTDWGLDIPALANGVGFTGETSLCFARMIMEGMLDEFPRLKLIACHGGGTLPYLAARLDRTWDKMVRDKKSQHPPSFYIRHRLYYDSILYDQETLDFLLSYVDANRVMYGSDYPFSLGDMKGIRERVDGLPPMKRDAVRGGNAVSLFGF